MPLTEAIPQGLPGNTRPIMYPAQGKGRLLTTNSDLQRQEGQASPTGEVLVTPEHALGAKKADRGI